MTSPGFRDRPLGCPKVPGSMRRRDPVPAVCSAEPGDDETCCIKSATAKAAYSSPDYQFPIWGSWEWTQQYIKRSAVERGYSMFKNQDVVGMARSQFRTRRLVNVTLLSILGWIVHNLHLRHLEDRAALAKPPSRRGRALLAA